MLLRNGTSLGSNPCRFLGMNAVLVTDLANWTKTGARLNLYVGEAEIDPLSGIPNGTEPPVAWLMAIRGGGLSTYNSINGAGDFDISSLSMGVAAAADLSGSGTVSSAALTLLLSLLADLTAAGSVSTATLTAQANLQSALTGSGDVTTAVLVLLYQMLADLSGSGTITDAQLQTIASLAADLAASGSVTVATLGLTVALAAALTASGTVSAAALDSIMRLAAALGGSGTISSASLAIIIWLAANVTGNATLVAALRGTLAMSADINVTGSEITTANIGTSVWGALAALNNDAGTMGEQMNNAGAGGNPWDTVIESGYTADEVMRILLAVAAGKTTVTSLGGGAATVVFRDQGDTKDRVSVDMQDSDRVAVAIDEV